MEHTETPVTPPAEEVGPRVPVLGEVMYRCTDFNRRTVAQDHHLQRNLRRIGADRVLPNADEDSTVYVMRLQCRIVDSGLAPEFIAGLILPADVEHWTPELATATARKIAELDTPQDREEVATLCVEIAFGYLAESLAKILKVQEYQAMVERSLTQAPNH